MKVKKGYVLREVADQVVVVPTGEQALNFNGILTLNSSGKFLWEQLQNDVTMDDLIAAMLNRYNVTKDVAKKDIEEFIGILKSKNILE